VGQDLTYSIKISNMSTNTKYLEAMKVSEPDYVGVGYEGLTVTETVPEGTVFVSATEGGVYDEKTNTVTWTLNIGAGKAVTPAYTVKVTADMGDTIVNGGGFVANIPSNTISNRVGGEKLNEFADTMLRPYGECMIFDFDAFEVSSTFLREGLSSGSDVSAYIDKSVCDYIQKEGLYKNE
jgi:hypothetical protein